MVAREASVAGGPQPSTEAAGGRQLSATGDQTRTQKETQRKRARKKRKKKATLDDREEKMQQSTLGDKVRIDEAAAGTIEQAVAKADEAAASTIEQAVVEADETAAGTIERALAVAEADGAAASTIEQAVAEADRAVAGTIGQLGRQLQRQTRSKSSRHRFAKEPQLQPGRERTEERQSKRGPRRSKSRLIQRSCEQKRPIFVGRFYK